MPTSVAVKNPAWTWIGPLAALLLIGTLSTGKIAPAGIILAGAALLLGWSVFAAVHHAEVVALRVGEPFGSIILAVAVTVIEVALIVSLMFQPGAESGTVARDTVYSAVMIVLNGVVGLCLVLGGARHHEQTFHAQGAASALGVLGTLATIALILPNYTTRIEGPLYSSGQLLVIGAVSALLYAIFVFVQSIRHRDYFLAEDGPAGAEEAHHPQPSARIAMQSCALLCAALVAVVLLAKQLSYPLKQAIVAAGLPVSFVGIVIAAVVLLPETFAALAAARANRLQTSLNLALGSAIASIGLTIPVVATVSVISGKPLALGISPSAVVLLVLTLFISTVTLATGRTTVLQGAIHLVIFAVFILVSLVP